MKYTQKLAEFVEKKNFQDFPSEAIEQAKMLMLDSLGCAIAGYTQAAEEVEWMVELAKKQCPSGNCTIICDGSKTCSSYAAMVNGGMVHTIDYDDTHMGSIVKFGSSQLGVSLALGEQYNLSGKDLITAFILGVEAGGRVGRCIMPSHYIYWHPTGTTAGVGAGVAAAKLLKQNAEQIEQVIGHCADAAGGMRYCIVNGDFSKTLHPALAAMKAVMFAELVGSGANGPQGILEYTYGFINAYSKDPNIEPLLDGLGEQYEIMEDSLKFYPTIQCSQTAISVALELIKEHNIKAEDIEKIELVHTATVPGQGCNPNPETLLAARLSIPFCMALCAYEGQVSLGQFTAEKLKDPVYVDFMRKVEITPSQELQTKYPETIASYMDIKCSGGKVYSGEQIYPKGDPRNRMSADEVKDKFRSLAATTLPKEQVEDIIQAVFTLEDADNIEHLIRKLKKDWVN